MVMLQGSADVIECCSGPAEGVGTINQQNSSKSFNRLT